MRTAVIFSERSVASMNIKERLLESGKWQDNKCGEATLVTIPGRTIDFEYPENTIDADRFIFATTHSSKSGIPTLSVHAPGNWGSASIGGEPRKLVPSMPSVMKHALKLILQHKGDLEFDVVQEVTHHGPCSTKPSMFIEIGSTEKEWPNKEAGRVIADVLNELLSDDVPKAEPAVAIGGPHTMPNFMKVIMGSEYAIGHACAKYALDDLDAQTLKQATECSGNCSTIIADWKGLGPHKEKIKSLCAELGLELRKTSEFPES